MNSKIVSGTKHVNNSDGSSYFYLMSRRFDVEKCLQRPPNALHPALNITNKYHNHQHNINQLNFLFTKPQRTIE